MSNEPDWKQYAYDRFVKPVPLEPMPQSARENKNVIIGVSPLIPALRLLYAARFAQCHLEELLNGKNQG